MKHLWLLKETLAFTSLDFMNLIKKLIYPSVNKILKMNKKMMNLNQKKLLPNQLPNKLKLLNQSNKKNQLKLKNSNHQSKKLNHPKLLQLLLLNPNLHLKKTQKMMKTLILKMMKISMMTKILMMMKIWMMMKMMMKILMMKSMKFHKKPLNPTNLKVDFSEKSPLNNNKVENPNKIATNPTNIKVENPNTKTTNTKAENPNLTIINLNTVESLTTTGVESHITMVETNLSMEETKTSITTRTSKKETDLYHSFISLIFFIIF